MKRNLTLAEQNAELDNLIFGTALPPTLARKQATPGYVKPRWIKDETEQEALRKQNQEIAKRVKETIEQMPLIAVCFNHACGCGNSWQAFGFYGRKVVVKTEGAADAYVTQRANALPGETCTDTEYLPVQEEACIKCYAVKVDHTAHVPIPGENKDIPRWLARIYERRELGLDS